MWALVCLRFTGSSLWKLRALASQTLATITVPGEIPLSLTQVGHTLPHAPECCTSQNCLHGDILLLKELLHQVCTYHNLCTVQYLLRKSVTCVYSYLMGLIPLVHCSLESLTWLMPYWKGRPSHEFRWSMTRGTSLFQYFNHGSDCTVYTYNVKREAWNDCPGIRLWCSKLWLSTYVASWSSLALCFWSVPATGRCKGSSDKDRIWMWSCLCRFAGCFLDWDKVSQSGYNMPSHVEHPYVSLNELLVSCNFLWHA